MYDYYTTTNYSSNYTMPTSSIFGIFTVFFCEICLPILAFDKNATYKG